MKKAFKLIGTIINVLSPILSSLLFLVAIIEMRLGLYSQAITSLLICVFIALSELNSYIKRHDWTPWEHVMYIEKFGGGVPCYELLKSECLNTGKTRYKEVRVSSVSHGLTQKMNDWENTRQLERNELNN